MKCTECNHLILSEGGVSPSPGWQDEVAAHVAACPDCRRLQANLATMRETWKADTAQVAIPDENLAWEELRPLLSQPTWQTKRRLAPLLWISAPLAAAAALAFVLLNPAAPAVSESAMMVRADYVEAGNPAASTMVYVDKDSGWLVVWAADSGSSG
jgi:hypothetical protein